MHPQPGERGVEVDVVEAGDDAGEGVRPRVVGGATAQRPHPLALLREVDQLEVDGERPGDVLRPRAVVGGSDPHRGLGVATAVAGRDDGVAQPLDVLEQVGATALGQHLAERVTEQAYVAAQLGGDLARRARAPAVAGAHGAEPSERRRPGPPTLAAWQQHPSKHPQQRPSRTSTPRPASWPSWSGATTRPPRSTRRRSQKRRDQGKLSARERIERLLDPGSFTETDALVRHRAHDFGLQDRRPLGDGVITGYGTVDGRPVCVFSHDATVFGGSLGEVYGEKIVKIMDLALKTGCPVVGINEGAGARIQEGVVSLGLYGEIFYRNVLASGVVPQISLIMGSCAGGHVYSPAITDFTLMVDQTSYMFITGPDIIKTVTGEDVTFEELGGARAHNTKSGVAQFMASDEDDCLELTRALLSYLPSNNMEEPPSYAEDDLDAIEPDTMLDTFIPDSSSTPYDMHTVIEHVLDEGEFLEVHEHFAQNMICGFGRVDGRSVGVVANQPMSFAGTLDIDASEKAARFVRTCDAYNVPILTFVDVPGFLPGTDQEWDGIIRRGAKLIYAYSEATVPKVTVITRKAYGGAYVVMGSKHLRADLNLAWPSAEVAVVGAPGAVNIIHRRRLAAADDPEAERAQLIEEYTDHFATPYLAAERGYVDAVIKPSDTRREVVKALRQLRTKRESLPPKKHGNIPL